MSTVKQAESKWSQVVFRSAEIVENFFDGDLMG